MPIRVFTKEVRYIHELSLTLEHSMSISSPAVPGLTHKDAFLAELARFCGRNNDHILVVGDFNIIRFSSEKNKNTGVHAHSDKFNYIISSYEFIDIHMNTGGVVCVKLNDQEGPYFVSHKGVRQVNPLTPILFSFVADYLARMVRQA